MAEPAKEALADNYYLAPWNIRVSRSNEPNAGGCAMQSKSMSHHDDSGRLGLRRRHAAADIVGVPYGPFTA